MITFWVNKWNNFLFKCVCFWNYTSFNCYIKRFQIQLYKKNIGNLMYLSITLPGPTNSFFSMGCRVDNSVVPLCHNAGHGYTILMKYGYLNTNNQILNFYLNVLLIFLKHALTFMLVYSCPDMHVNLCEHAG